MNNEFSKETPKASKGTFETIRGAVERKRLAAGAGILLVGSLALSACSPSEATPPPAPETSTSAEPTAEAAPEMTAEQEVAANIAERPTEGSPEYEALVDSYRINASEQETREDIISSMGSTLVGDWFAAGMEDIPEDLYDTSALGIEDKINMIEPEYWDEVFSKALFGAASADLKPAQREFFDRVAADHRTFIAQRIITASEEHPTEITILDDSATIEQDTGRFVKGTYSYTFQPNADNYFTNLNGNDFEGTPRRNDIELTMEGDLETNNWYYVPLY